MDISTNFLSITSTNKIEQIEESENRQDLPIISSCEISQDPVSNDTLTVGDKEVDIFGTEKTYDSLKNFVLSSKLEQSRATTGLTSAQSTHRINFQRLMEDIESFHNPKITWNIANSWNANNATLVQKTPKDIYSYLTKISPNRKVTKRLLTELTKDDYAEDHSSDLMGCINRAFSHYSTDQEISYEDFKLLFINSANKDSSSGFKVYFDEFKTAVQNYSSITQRQYQSLSAQKKLEFALQKVEEYFQAAGMQNELDALNRLKSQTDNFSNGAMAIVGNIKITNNLPTGQLGGYNNFKLEGASDTYGNYNLKSFAGDEDSAGGDAGISLSSVYLNDSNYKWYNLVETLIHELTHATAYKYYGEYQTYQNRSFNVSQETIKLLHEHGFLGDLESQYYTKANGIDWTRLKNDLSSEEIYEIYDRLSYLTNCLWGEFRAYKHSSDYYDSIGADELNEGDKTCFLSVNNILDDHNWLMENYLNEYEVIKKHIEQNYNNEPIPPGTFLYNFA